MVGKYIGFRFSGINESKNPRVAPVYSTVSHLSFSLRYTGTQGVKGLEQLRDVV